MLFPQYCPLCLVWSLQGCYQIELEEIFVSDLTKIKPLETCWEPGEDSEILINMLNIHINIPPDIYLFWTYWLEWDGGSCLYTPRLNDSISDNRTWYLSTEFLCCKNISATTGWIAMKFCTHKHASKMVYANVLVIPWMFLLCHREGDICGFE